METQNVTLAIPKQVLSDARLLVMKRQTSLSALVTQMLAEMVAEENGYTKARDHHLGLLNAEPRSGHALASSVGRARMSMSANAAFSSWLPTSASTLMMHHTR